jgi:hypothetical protein
MTGTSLTAEEQKRLLYERIILSDIHDIQSNSRFTAKCHYSREKSMRQLEEYSHIVTRVCGVSGIIAPLLEGTRLRVIGPIASGCVFYLADQLNKHFKTEKEKSFRAAGKWMSLYTTATTQKSRIISAYSTTELNEKDINEIRWNLCNLKIALDNDPDSTTNDEDFNAANQGFDKEEASWLSDSLEEIKKLRSVLGMKVPLSTTPSLKLQALLGDTNKGK